MPKTRTYYDELNVSRDASADEIKHAFRKLAQQLHPDRNHTANASDLMAVVNAAHDVLANPQKRAEYDATLIREAQLARQAAAQRRQAGPQRAAAQPAANAQARASAKKPQSKKTTPAKRGNSLRWAAVFLVACGAGAWMGYDRDAGKAAVVPPLAQETPVVVQPPVAAVPASAPAELPVNSPVKIVEPGEPECVPPPLDPLGAPWPMAASYIAGMPMLRDGGWSEITVDNTAGDKPVYAKVTDASGKRDYRHAFIPARGRFTFQRMDVGYYQLKYKMLDTGCAYASSRIRLEETLVGDRIKSSMYKLTLRKLSNRNSQFSNVRSEEF